MKAVAYIRMSTCHPFMQIPANHITQQSNRIKAYAKNKGWKITSRYCDRKHDSTECTAFEQMVEDGIQRKFDLVIVDSIFGAGRDLQTAKRVLLQTFHYAGISFAVVEDNFLSKGKSISEVEAYFQNAEFELKRAIMRERNMERSQKLCWNDIKFGYRLSDSGEMVIDPQTAPIVQKIYQMRLSGKTLSEIASTLNREGVPRPSANRKADAMWQISAIHGILHNSAYIGHWVKTVQGKPMQLENDAIISREDYDAIQRMSAPTARKAGYSAPRNLLASLVVDGGSGETLKIKKTYSGEIYFAYNMNCVDGNGHRIPYDDVHRIALATLESECRLARDMEKLLPEGLECRKQKALEEIRQDMRHQFEDTANKLKSENNSEIVKETEPVFRMYMDTVEEIELAFSHKNPWIRLYSDLRLDSLDNNISFRRCIEKIEVSLEGNIVVVPKELKWKQLLAH